MYKPKHKRRKNIRGKYFKVIIGAATMLIALMCFVCIVMILCGGLAGRI